MQNFFLLIAGMGLFYTTLTGTLYDMTVADCNAGIELACKELQQWIKKNFRLKKMLKNWKK